VGLPIVLGDIKMKLVKFSCGCIGLVDPSGEREPVAFSVCDSQDGGSFTVSEREDLLTKTYSPLSDDEFYRLVDELRDLVVDGYSFRAIERAVKSLVVR